MLDYKECHLSDFEAAMAQKDEDVKNISTEYLYILYTKFRADARVCAQNRTGYALCLSISSDKRADMYLKELQTRGVQI